jgi:hypothetical protein
VYQSCPRGVDFVEWVLSINRSLVKSHPTLHYRGLRSPVIFVGVVAVIVRGKFIASDSPSCPLDHIIDFAMIGSIGEMMFESHVTIQIKFNLFFPHLLALVNSLAIKNTEDNGTTKKDPASSDLLNDGEQ